MTAVKKLYIRFYKCAVNNINNLAPGAANMADLERFDLYFR